MQTIQIDDDKYVFTQQALQEALQAGEVAEDYKTFIKREQARQAAQDVLTGACNTVTGYVRQVKAAAKLEMRMAAFDMWHGTNYRRIRHAIMEEDRKRQFETSIGLERKI